MEQGDVVCKKDRQAEKDDLVVEGKGCKPAKGEDMMELDVEGSDGKVVRFRFMSEVRLLLGLLGLLGCWRGRGCCCVRRGCTACWGAAGRCGLCCWHCGRWRRCCGCLAPAAAAAALLLLLTLLLLRGPTGGARSSLRSGEVHLGWQDAGGGAQAAAHRVHRGGGA